MKLIRIPASAAERLGRASQGELLDWGVAKLVMSEFFGHSAALLMSDPVGRFSPFGGVSSPALMSDFFGQGFVFWDRIEHRSSSENHGWAAVRRGGDR
jgi:hypothetical protein